jgi:hypothetical protein
LLEVLLRQGHYLREPISNAQMLYHRRPNSTGRTEDNSYAALRERRELELGKIAHEISLVKTFERKGRIGRKRR